ncbi:MAG TPA: regulatory protein RecX [Bacteroidia bacterium]|nr:regulatory protein RecX [Bacteroidia bacterium]
MKNWCAYQERSQFEVRNKLFEYGIFNEEAENIISQLIQENFLNEERFALAFARGKFRIKRWGRIKIKLELKQHKVSEYCISKALKQIDGNEYFATLEKIIEKKTKEIKESNKIKKQYKIIKYAMSRGYEQDIIMDAIKKLENNES